MGGIVKGILGKKSAKRQASAEIAAAERSAKIVEPFVQTGIRASTAVAGALGLEGGEAQTNQFQNFLSSTGFKAQIKEGTDAITSSRAARGLLGSGSTLKRINTFGQDLAQRGFSNFLSNLQNVATRGANTGVNQATALQQGLSNAAGIRAGGENAFARGVGGLVDTGFQLLGASDRRLKDNIKKVGEDRGLNVYTWAWNTIATEGIVPSDEPQVGFMADEVERLYPHHVGVRGGYKYINYDALDKELREVA